MQVSLIIISFIVITLFQGCNKHEKLEISQWRGSERNGIYNETDLLNQWTENGPELLWAFNGIGKGYAAPVVLNDKIFVNGEQDSNSYLFALDLQGNLLWKAANGKEFMGEGFSSTYPGSRSTPTVINNLVYATSGMGRIACFETDSGIEKWAVDLVKDLGGVENYFGYSESVVVDDDKVYCFPGGAETNLAALNRFTGKPMWLSEALKDTFSYCSPILVKLPTRNVLVSHSRHFIFAVDCNTGNVVSHYEMVERQTDGDHCNTPLYDDGNIYFIGFQKKYGAVKLELSNNAENMKEIWHKPNIKNNFNGYVTVDNKLFTTVKGNWLKAINLENGSVEDSIKVATGSIIYADNKFICYGMNGEVNLISYNQNKLEITGTFKIEKGTGQHFSHPVIDKRILYIRHGNALLAYKI